MTPVPSFGEAARVWAGIGLNSFGGPAAQIALMHKTLVDDKQWVSEGRFLHALNFCMLLPGPEAQQLATYLGWLLHGVRGGLVAGLLFVLPGYLALMALSIAYVALGDVTAVTAALYGLKAAVLAVVVEAVARIGKRVLKNPAMYALAAAAFVALFVFAVPFPLVVVGAGLAGLLGARIAPRSFVVLQGVGGGKGVVDHLLDGELPEPARPDVGRAVRTALAWAAIWLVPVGALWLALGPDHVYARIATFFSQAAVVTFGGAYAVLAYIAQAAVETYGWLRPEEMLDGLGMAETTPGPLIMVVEFVGFVAAYRNPGDLPPLLAGLLGATLTTWVTFAPCFLWIFVGAPWVEALRGRPALAAALSAITAAVVGVVLNLAVWFALHVVFAEVTLVAGPLGTRWQVPAWPTVDVGAALIALGSAVAILRFHVGLVRVLMVAMVAGVVLHAFGA